MKIKQLTSAETLVSVEVFGRKRDEKATLGPCVDYHLQTITRTIAELLPQTRSIHAF
jgi:hypothetical protein